MIYSSTTLPLDTVEGEGGGRATLIRSYSLCIKFFMLFTLLCALAAGAWINLSQATASAMHKSSASHVTASAVPKAMAEHTARTANTAEETRPSPQAWSKRELNEAFQAAEAWRKIEVERLYADMTDQDWDTARRWKQYAAPDAPERTCAQPLPRQLLEDILGLSAALTRSPATLTNASKTKYLALLAYHSTGLEGNTLTLQQTELTVQGMPLAALTLPLAATVQGTTPSATTTLSTDEAFNTALLYGRLHLADHPKEGHRPIPLAHLTLSNLIGMNSDITKGTGTQIGLRRRHVSIGHRRTMLPMPDEVPVLMEEYMVWLTKAVATTAATALPEAEQLQATLALACNAHTRFVFIHPFADGNGRLARTLSALVLQHGSLPAPMIMRQHRSEYMDAVSVATSERNYAPLALIHAQAVHRSLSCIAELLWSQKAGDGKGVAGDESVMAMAARGGGCFPSM